VTTETAIFAAGCFWQVEAEFRGVDGVVATTVGYTGGTAENPSYRQVCGGRTGHAEAVRVEYDPNTVSYDDLLEVFWAIHDPTTRNRQGWDVGTQYRSAIFVEGSDQEIAAHRSLANVQARFRKPIVTEITAASTFWPAEEHHQRYLEKKGRTTCAVSVRDPVEVPSGWRGVLRRH
jgi:peptide-methionine (S)-S-oxide reductase